MNVPQNDDTERTESERMTAATQGGVTESPVVKTASRTVTPFVIAFGI